MKLQIPVNKLLAGVIVSENIVIQACKRWPCIRVHDLFTQISVNT